MSSREEWKMRVVFSTRTGPREYISQDIRRNDPGWGTETFVHPIRSLVLFLPSSHRIVMHGMCQYNFFVEATQAFSRRSGARIKAFWLAGLPPSSDIVEMWRIGGNQVSRHRKPYGAEWGGGPTSGWKIGEATNNPRSVLIRMGNG